MEERQRQGFQYVKELYKSIDKGWDLPPPSELTGPSGDILYDYFDEKLRKTLKKLNKHRKKLLKENKLKKFVVVNVNPPLERNPSNLIEDSDSAQIKIEPPEVEVIKIVKINQPDNNFHELDDPDLFDDFHDVPDQIIANNDGRTRTRTRTRSISPTPAKRRAPTRNLTKIANRKTIDELSKEIEKEKRLIILLKPLTVNIPPVKIKIESPIYYKVLNKRNSDSDGTTKLKDQHEVQEMDLKEPNLISLRTPLNELVKEIEKEKRLIILLEPLSVYSPAYKSPTNSDDDEIKSDFNEVHSDDDYVPKKKRTRQSDKNSVKKTAKGKRYKKIQCPLPKCKVMIAWNNLTIHIKAHIRSKRSKSRIYEKISCPRPNCGALIAWNFLPNHLRTHSRNFMKKSRSRSKMRPISKKKLRKLELIERICPYCAQSFKNLDLHIETMHEGTRQTITSKVLQHKEKPIDCSICLKNFQDENSEQYFIHMKTHNSSWEIICTFCSLEKLSFLIFNDYKKHIQSIHPYQCPVYECNVSFTHIKSFRQHVRDEHPEKCEEFGVRLYENKFVCSYCSDTFCSNPDLEKHLIMHENPEKLVCTICHRQFTREGSLKYHMANQHGEKTIPCLHLGCNKLFGTNAALKDHSYYHNPNSVKMINRRKRNHTAPKIFICTEPNCKKKFSIMAEFRYHKYREHQITIQGEDHLKKVQLEENTCTICFKTMKTKSSYTEHMLNHEERSIPCTFPGCYKLFSSQNSLRSHSYYHDPNSAKMINKMFGNSSNYIHIKVRPRVSQKKTSFKCTENGCNLEFPDKSKYQNHKSVFHDDTVGLTDQEVFQCPIEFCTAKSESKKVLNIHIKLEHAEHSNDFIKNAEKKFKCSYCDRSYNYQHALKDHEISHTDPAQSTCEICNKFYSSKTMKNLHRKEAHGSKEFKCSFPNCPSMFSTEVNLRRHIKMVHHKK